jgi:hypothetical protein
MEKKFYPNAFLSSLLIVMLKPAFRKMQVLLYKHLHLLPDAIAVKIRLVCAAVQINFSSVPSGLFSPLPAVSLAPS